MYEEDVKEYRDAKRKACKPFGSEKSLSLGSHLPSNAEIHQELHSLIRLHEGEVLPERLLRMRLIALKYMELFSQFSPYLVGSVLSGSVTDHSDIDLHLFADDPEEVERYLAGQNIPFETDTVCVRKGSEFIDYTHIYLEEDGVPIECSIYPWEDRRRATKSSITGRAMERASEKKVREMIGSMVSTGERLEE